MDDFEANSARFLAWFKSVGGEFRDDLIQIADLRAQGGGRGVVAITDIPKDTLLFSIPRDAILSVLTSELPTKLPHLFEDDDVVMDGASDIGEVQEGLDSWGRLILVLLYEYLRGDVSKWKPYFDVLPLEFDTPIFWSSAELEELRGTSLTAEKIGSEESDAMLRRKILPVILENPSVFYSGGDGMTPMSPDGLLRLAHRMGSTIMAYAFDLESEDDAEDEEDGWVEDREGRTLLGMVPMADMLNANAEFNAHVNHGDKLEVTAIFSGIRAGDEILNYYGPLPTSDLLRRYGYITKEHQRYDVVEIPCSLVQQALKTHLAISDEDWATLTSQIDEEEDIEETFLLERDAGDPNPEGRLVEQATFREIPPEMKEQVKIYLKAFKKADPARVVVVPDKRRRDEICDAVVEHALRERLRQFPTSVEEDRALLALPDLGRRKRMAAQVRLGEKILLEEAIFLMLAQRRSGASLGDDAGEEPSAKRARIQGLN